MSDNSLEVRIVRLGEKKCIERLRELIENTSIDALTTALKTKLGRSDCITFWNYLLEGFDIANAKQSAIEKRFACVKCLLDGLLTTELSYKQTYDLVTRLCQHLPTFPTEQLIEILEHCVDGIRMGDRCCVSWKDLLPETLNVLAQQSQLKVNGVAMTGRDYRDSTVRNLCTMRWPIEVLTPIADMFKELGLRSNEILVVLNKFAGLLQSLAPTELPSLAFQLFSMCSTATEIMILILAFEKYFHRYYYKKLFADMLSNSTDFDSIEAYSDKELREAEETILHHLNYCTQYKISEIQMCVVLRNFTCMPDIILTPFVLSAIISMTAANREPDSQRLSTAYLLHLLRNVIQHNEQERTLADYSVWCRDSLQRKQVHLDQIFTVLIDQNKEGKDVITPGLVNLVFILLKAKNNPTLNGLAIAFLTKFIRKRFVFGQGIVKKLAEWMVVEQDQYQYGECLMLLSVADTFTVSECVKTINYVLDFLLWLPGEQAMRMMSFILPILKLSAIVRDAFIEVLRKAMNCSDVKTPDRHRVYGFCMILKQLNNSNSQRSQMSASGICTQHSISGFSLMSQATLGNRSNPQRHFDMLTLEIIGILRNCFNYNLDIKRILYENLQRAVELNPKLVPHVMQFIDWHFRSYFRTSTTDEDELAVVFEKIAHTSPTNEFEIDVHDNLGRLILFVSHCLVIFEKFESEYDVREMQRLLQMSVEKVVAKEMHFEEKTDNWTPLKRTLVEQQLNFLEGLMAYVLLTSKQSNDKIKQLLPLFRAHAKLSSVLKTYSGSTKKLQKKSKEAGDSDATEVLNITINGVTVKKFEAHVDNIWDLSVIEKFLRLLHEDIVPFAAVQHTTALRANCELVRYVLEVAANKAESIRLEPEYKQLAHSKRTLKYLTDITKVVYERCVRRLPELWRDFDVKTAALAAECFQQCLQTANTVYKKKFVDIFVKGFDFYVINNCKPAASVLHDVIDDFMQEQQQQAASQTQSAAADPEAANRGRIPRALLQCLEVLYDNLSFEDRLTAESYTWLMKFCKCYEVKSKDLSLVHKLLFTQRQKTHSGAFFNTIALHLCNILGAISDEQYEKECPLSFELKSLKLESAESYFQYLCQALRKQIEDVDYFIMKANNLNFKYRLVTDEERDICLAQLRSMERSICTQLVHISNALLHLTNACLPMGACMDLLLKLLIQHYDCLKNLAKHFLNCCAVDKISIPSTKFDLLLHAVGKPLPKNIYALITYIEANIVEKEQRKKSNPQAERARILRETKLIPKIILHVETFNRHVIFLAKKTNNRLTNFLHQGTVHDYRFRTRTLKAAVERTLSHRSEIEVDPSEQNETEEDRLLERIEAESAAMETGRKSNNVEEDDDEEDDASTNFTGDENVETNIDEDNDGASSTGSSIKATAKSRRVSGRRRLADDNDVDGDDAKSEPERSTSTATTPDNLELLENESMQESATQLRKNLAKINKQAKKRMLQESAESEASVGPVAKRRRGRSAKK